MAIDCFFDSYNYPLDTHTAVAVTVYNNYVAETGDFTPTVIVATASPFKFPSDVYGALAHEKASDPFIAADKLAFISGIKVPDAIRSLLTKNIVHDKVVEKDKIDEAVLSLTEE